MFGQGSFINSAATTPEELARKRAEIAAMMPRFGNARYVGEGLGQLFMGIGLGRQQTALDGQEREGRASAQERFNAILGGGIQGRAQPGGFSVLGSIPLPEAKPNSPEGIAADTMAALGKTPTEDTIRDGLIARGLPPHIADGFVMNMKDESGLNPGINEIAPLVPGSRGGFGLSQWTGPRRVALEEFAAAQGKPVDDWNVQLDFLMHELQGPEAAAWAKISQTQDPGSAAAAIATDFLRPAQEHLDRRVAAYTGGMNSPQMTAAMIPTEELIALASNGYLSPEQRAMAQAMLDQQMKMNDPAYTMGLRAQELAIQQAERDLATAETPKPIEVGGVLVDPVTFQPLFDSRQPEAAPRPLTPEERRAWGIPDTDTTPYALGADGMPKAIGGGGVTVNNDMGGGKFDDEFAKGDAATLVAVSDAGLAATRNIGRIDQLDALLATNPTGGGAAFQQAAAEWGIELGEGVSELQAAEAIINSLVPEQRQPGSGPMSDADLALFKRSLPRIINQPGGNRIILDTMRAIAQYDAKGAQIVQDLRAGKIDRATAFQQLQQRENPLAGFKAPAGGDAPGTEGASGDVPTFNPETGMWE